MPSPEDIARQQDLLQTHRLTLHHYLTQQAKSMYTPPEVFHGIREARQNIQRIKSTLRVWSVYVEDHPDDDEDDLSKVPIAVLTGRDVPSPDLTPPAILPSDESGKSEVYGGQRSERPAKGLESLYRATRDGPLPSPSFESAISPPELAPKLEREKLELRVKNVIYDQLRGFLETESWKDADRETTKVILTITKRQEEGGLLFKNIREFPCSNIEELDYLWRTYSRNRFGFSVQREIWRSVGGQPGKYSFDIFEKFGENTGWRVNGEWLNAYDEFIFDIQAPEGHLPSLRFFRISSETNQWGEWIDCFKEFLSRVENCSFI